MTRYFKQPSTTAASHNFSQVPRADIPRSKFDRSSAHKTTYDAGKLVPVFVDEILPGDTFHMKSTQFARLATPLRPIMDNIQQDLHFWFVPCRLVMDDWQKFMGERPDPDFDPNTISIPQTSIVLGDIAPTSVAGYMGLPFREGVNTPISVSALFFRAYVLIYNEWYRDQNLQPTIPFSKGPGPDDWSGFCAADSCFPRGKRKDYFTGALPWPQKGDPVLMPVGDLAPIVGSAPVHGLGVVTTATANTGPVAVDDTTGADVTYEYSYNTSSDIRLNASGSGTNKTPVVRTLADDPSSTLMADLSAASAVTINDLRNAIAIQRALEADARGGTRYIEIILNRFGVASDDARLQRPEYLGGSTSTVNINPVTQTSMTLSGSTPQGNLAAIGTGVVNAGFTKSFTEHGIIIGIASVRADLNYQQGINRMWSREVRDDFYWPEYAHLGEQTVLNKEIYVQGTAQDDEIFGYQERFAEYRYKPGLVTGLMSSEQNASLDSWHLAQEFSELPTLSSSFIVENPPIDRCIAVPAEPHFIADFWFSLQCDRPMPVYSVPGLDTI